MTLLKKTPTRERLIELLSYDPETGVFTWNKDRGPRVHQGSVAGRVGHQGYRRIKIDGSTEQASRLAWLFVNGELPEACIDHVNGIRSDDRIENLRACTVGENNQNLGRTKANKSGFIGVSWKTSHSRWCAQIKHLGTVHHLGLFNKIADAVKARAKAKALMHTFNPVDADRLGVTS